MKVESSFVIEGNIVNLKFESRDIIIYEHSRDQSLYVVRKAGRDVIVRIDVITGMGQGEGYVESFDFVSLEDES